MSNRATTSASAAAGLGISTSLQHDIEFYPSAVGLLANPVGSYLIVSMKANHAIAALEYRVTASA
jgi:hypothetical protein